MTDQNQLLSDALQKGLEYARLALSEHEAKYGRHPAVEADHKVIVDDVTELEEALDHLAEGQELVSLCGRVKISGPREDVEHIVRLLPDVDDQPAEGGEVADYKALYEDAMRASNEAGFVGLDAAATIRALSELTTPPASHSQAQQPSTQAWANETGLRQIDCPSCGDLAVAYDPQQPSGEVAKAWAEGYRQGIADERTSEANIGIAGFGAKVEPNRQNPYLTLATPKPEPMTEHQRGNLVMDHLGPHALTGDKMSPLDAFTLGIDATEAHHGIKGQA